VVRNPAAFGGNERKPPPLLGAFAEWLEERGESEAAAVARRYGAASPLGIELELPGPVGELNLYALRPRGRVLLSPENRAGLYAQMAAVLATGNRGTVIGMDLPPDLTPEIGAAFVPLLQSNDHCVAALVEGSAAQVGQIVKAVAAMPGPIVPVHAADANAPIAYPLFWLLKEVSTSINTTAAGGNARLMTIE
jgi:RHH-type proline utilization regulon transcriptional repressor/proline dehydrogenase/delta 1-pyrroline-5-carboxylate dehydrogenase